jgi:hypothetical protein
MDRRRQRAMIKLEHRNEPTDDRSTLNGHKITSSAAAEASSTVVDDWTPDYVVIVRG